MGRSVRTAYEVAPRRSGRRRTILAGLDGLVVVTLLLLIVESCDSADGEPTSRTAGDGSAVPALEGAAGTEPTPEGAARAAAWYVVAINDAGLLNSPRAQRALVEAWVTPERQPSWLADLQLTQGTIATTIAEAGSDPRRTLVRAHPLGYRVEQRSVELVRVEIWQLYAIVGPDWPGLSGTATTELVMRWTPEGWRVEDGDEVAGPELPGSRLDGGSDSGRLARELERFVPFAP